MENENILIFKKNELMKLSDADYFARPELNFSTFKNFLVSGKYFEAKKDEEEKESDSLLFGSIFHASVLDREELSKYKTFPVLDKRTKAGKEQWEILTKEAEEKKLTLVSEEIFNDATNVNLTPVVKGILEEDGNIYENSVLWDYQSLHLKSKIDIYNPNTKTLVDVKTTRDLPGFERVINSSRYYMQMAFYQMALEACGYEVNSWKIIAVENTAPFDNTVFTFTKDYIDYSMAYLKVKLDAFIFESEIAGFKGLSEEKEIEVELPKYFY